MCRSREWTIVIIIFVIHALLGVLAFLLLSDGGDRESIATFNSSLFVAIMQHGQLTQTNLEAQRATWLRRLDSIVFTEELGGWQHINEVQLPPATRTDIGRLRWMAAYIDDIVKTDADWFLFTTDTSYIVTENLLPLLADQSTTEPRFGVLQNMFQSGYYMFIANRRALRLLAAAHQYNWCSRMTSLHCLTRVLHVRRFPLGVDTDGQLLYYVQQRHFERYELKVNTLGGVYTDGAQYFDTLSSHVHSFYNVNSRELAFLHMLIYDVEKAET